MDVCEWPYQSHMQLHAFRDSLRKEFEEVKKERSIFEKKCEELQKKLRTTKEKKAAMKKQYQELQLKQLQEKLQQIEGTHKYVRHRHIFHCSTLKCILVCV